MVGWIDLDRGGSVTTDICNSLRLILEEKENKIQNFFHLYSEWWLVLIDFIGLPLLQIHMPIAKMV